MAGAGPGRGGGGGGAGGGRGNRKLLLNLSDPYPVKLRGFPGAFKRRKGIRTLRPVPGGVGAPPAHSAAQSRESQVSQGDSEARPGPSQPGETGTGLGVAGRRWSSAALGAGAGSRGGGALSRRRGGAARPVRTRPPAGPPSGRVPASPADVAGRDPAGAPARTRPPER